MIIILNCKTLVKPLPLCKKTNAYMEQILFFVYHLCICTCVNGLPFPNGQPLRIALCILPSLLDIIHICIMSTPFGHQATPLK